jgi:hypothetical protein
MREPLIAGIRRLIEVAGREGLDPQMTAVALAAMTEQFSYLWFVEGLGPGLGREHIEEAAEGLARLWLSALDLERRRGRA